MRYHSLLLAALFLCASSGTSAFAGPADLDPTFGSDGKVTVTLAGNGVARAVVIQPDGKIVAVGNDGSDSVLVRVDSSGALDASFGSGGVVTIDFGTTERLHAVLRQTDGKIVVAGEMTTFGTTATLARCQTNGALDGSFGAGGLVLTLGYIARALVETSAATFVGGGPGSSSGFTLVRYTSSGAVDGSFGSGGIAVAFAGSPSLELYALALQPDGKIIAVGGGDATVAVARFNDDGTLDGTFGTGGEVTTAIPVPLASSTTGGEATAVALQPDGSIVVAATSVGSVMTPPMGIVVPLSQAQVLRYADDGTLDATFGDGGHAFLNQMPSYASADAVLMQPDGKIVAAGQHSSGNPSPSYFLARVTSTGDPDGSFTSDPGSAEVVGGGNAVALQTDHKLIVAGFGGLSGASSFQILRYQGGTCGDAVLDGAEGCDDGNLVSGDGCDANCTPTGCGNGIVTAGEDCEPASGECCAADCHFAASGTPCAGDGDACSNHSCDGAGSCDSVVLPAPTCVTTVTRGSQIKIAKLSTTAPPPKRSLQWGWKGTGVAVGDFDDPRATDYALCVYDRSGNVPSLKMRVRTPGPSNPSYWRQTENGFDYKERTATYFGVQRVILQVGGSGIAKMKLKAKGPMLGPPESPLPMSVDPKVTVQLRNAAGGCWGANFSAPTVNTGEGFKAKSD